jgi:hypothetical protein
MTLPLAVAFLWLILANVIAMFPSRDHHWRAAYVLIAVGIPLIGWVTYTNGPFWGLVLLACGASVLRWPVYRLWRWMRRRVTGPAE